MVGVDLLEELEKVKASKKKKSNGNKNTATPTLPATRCYIDSWGYFNIFNKIIIEQINPNTYFYNHDGKKGLVEIEGIKEIVEGKEKTVAYGFTIGGIEYRLKNKPMNAGLFYNVPSIHKIEQFLEGKIKSKPFSKLYEELKQSLEDLF